MTHNKTELSDPIVYEFNGLITTYFSVFEEEGFALTWKTSGSTELQRISLREARYRMEILDKSDFVSSQRIYS